MTRTQREPARNSPSNGPHPRDWPTINSPTSQTSGHSAYFYGKSPPTVTHPIRVWTSPMFIIKLRAAAEWTLPVAVPIRSTNSWSNAGNGRPWIDQRSRWSINDSKACIKISMPVEMGMWIAENSPLWIHGMTLWLINWLGRLFFGDQWFVRSIDWLIDWLIFLQVDESEKYIKHF